MARLQRRWRVAKWLGVVLTFSAVVVSLISMRYAFYWFGQASAVRVSRGAMEAILDDLGFRGWHARRIPILPVMIGMPKAGWNNGRLFKVCIPLWIPFLSTAIPTIVLFRRDRRIPPHCCQACGYDLMGNTSGRCPECGASAGPPGPKQ
jgi:hypothetical protein